MVTSAGFDSTDRDKPPDTYDGSQGALALSGDHHLLFAVDAGSNEVSALAIEGEKPVPIDRVSSGGVRPVSVTVHKFFRSVLNNTDGAITGFTVNTDGTPSALARSTQPLIGGADADPAGRAGPPVKNDSSGRVPFGFTFAGKDLLIVSELSDATSSYRTRAWQPRNRRDLTAVQRAAASRRITR
jgi:6-phosphogluconolactonase